MNQVSAWNHSLVEISTEVSQGVVLENFHSPRLLVVPENITIWYHSICFIIFRSGTVLFRTAIVPSTLNFNEKIYERIVILESKLQMRARRSTVMSLSSRVKLNPICYPSRLCSAPIRNWHKHLELNYCRITTSIFLVVTDIPIVTNLLLLLPKTRRLRQSHINND